MERAITCTPDSTNERPEMPCCPESLPSPTNQGAVRVRWTVDTYPKAYLQEDLGRLCGSAEKSPPPGGGEGFDSWTRRGFDRNLLGQIRASSATSEGSSGSVLHGR